MRAKRPGFSTRSALGIVARRRIARPLTSTTGSIAKILPAKSRPGTASSFTWMVCPTLTRLEEDLGHAEIDLDRVDIGQGDQLLADRDIVADADRAQADDAL
jgi:hypothetical protein